MLMTLEVLFVIGLVAGQQYKDIKDDSICPQNESYVQLEVNKSYIVAVLAKGQDHKVPRNCNLLVKTREKGWGLMVYVESMYLRGQEAEGCVDYIQFGKDDLIPFVTLKRSKKMCGDVSNWAFDVDNGAMNIWMHFDDNRPKFYREKFAVVHLNMVITPYKKKPARGFRQCHSPGHYLPENYFCDNVINCATDTDYKGAADESDEVCRTTTSTTTTTTTLSPTFPTIQTTYINIGFESEDLRLGTIISVSLGVLVGLACCMVCCVKRCSRMSLPPTPTSDPDECHEMRLSGLPSGHQQRMIPRGGTAPETDRIGGYAASSHYTGISDSSEAMPPRGNTPPPAYSEIFPDGYQPKQLSTNLVSKEDRVDSTEV